MAKTLVASSESPTRKPLIWIHGEVKTPPFSSRGRQEAGLLLRLLQEGERLGMPQAEPLPIVAVLYEFAMPSTIGELCIALMRMR